MSTATQQWSDLVRSYEDAGHPPSSAVKQASVTHPALHRRMLQETNVSRPNASVHSNGPAIDASAIQAFDDAVQSKINQGQDKATAVRNTVNEDPDLHQRYLAAYNAAHRR